MCPFNDRNKFFKSNPFIYSQIKVKNRLSGDAVSGPEEQGEICIKSPQNFLGYLNALNTPPPDLQQKVKGVFLLPSLFQICPSPEKATSKEHPKISGCQTSKCETVHRDLIPGLISGSNFCSKFCLGLKKRLVYQANIYCSF